MNSKGTAPTALFDAIDHMTELDNSRFTQAKHYQDYKMAYQFLTAYNGSRGTFNAYRREVERLLHWSWLIANKTLTELKRDDIEAFIYFCQQPPKSWIGIKKATRFLERNGERTPNLEWRPFVATVSKAAYRKGARADVTKFELSQNAIKECFAILSSFFNYLIQEEYAAVNPVALIRQKSKFIRKRQGSGKIRRLTEMQWQFVIDSAKQMAEQNPALHERTLFIMSALYSMYLRISELAASLRWEPTMNDFERDHDGNWWFTTVGKGNKERQIAVSDSMLTALKRYRQFLNLSPLPSPADSSPLFPKTKGRGAITSTTYIREIVQACFDQAINNLKRQGLFEEAENLNEATVHWLRHTGISDDVKHRPREHVRDDAGHSSSAITDRYIDIELRERHASAKRKQISDD